MLLKIETLDENGNWNEIPLKETGSLKLINRYPRKTKKQMKKSGEWQRLFGGPKYEGESILSPSHLHTIMFGN